MACLQAGTVLSVTVEQVLENCLLVFVKHKSRIFRGVLFDEKNAVVFRTSTAEPFNSQESKKVKLNGGSTLADSASRWSTRQASLYYKRQNHKSFPCRRIPSLFSEVQVLTDADLIMENDGSLENMEGTSITLTKAPSALSENKTKTGQVFKGKDTSGRKADLLSQGNVTSLKAETNLKRKKLHSELCDRPSKKQPNKVNIVNKGVQKTTDKKKTKTLGKRSRKAAIGNGGTGSQQSSTCATKSASSTDYKLITTSPRSVPVAPVGLTPRTSGQKSDTVLILKKVDPPDPVGMNNVCPSEDLAPMIDNLSGENTSENAFNYVQDEESGKRQIDQECRKKQRDNENNLEDVSERTEGIPECLGNSAKSDMVTGKLEQVLENSVPVSESHDHFSEAVHNETAMIETFLRDGTDSLEIQEESNSSDAVIKRSARIRERRARFNLNQLLPYIEESQDHKSISEEYTLANMLQPDTHHVEQVFKTVNNEFLNSAEDHNVVDLTSMKNQPLKRNRHSRRKNTKYTQRMTWQLQPQVAPGNQCDPVGVGDIVWGKVHGHPWWPGKVLAISGIRCEDSTNPWDRDAHVSWFGSNTSSIIRLHFLQLFAPNFSKRHKRRKKGCYRLAVKQAKEAVQALINIVTP